MAVVLPTRGSKQRDSGTAGGRPGFVGFLRRNGWNLVFLTPMVVLFLAFTVWPIVASWVYAFFEWDGVEPLTEFVGFDNFREVLTDPLFWNAAWHSLLFSLGAIVIQVPLALLLAVLLNKLWLRGRNIYRLLIFLPVVSTMAVVGIIFRILLDPVGGPLNAAVGWFGIDPINFLGDNLTALPTVVAVAIWHGIGITLVYWLATLQTVPQDLYDAAAIDGANARQTLTRITLPMVAPLAVVILALTFQRSLNPFDLVQAMTAGGPGRATDVEATYVYRLAFGSTVTEHRYGFASAAGATFGVLVLAVTLLLAPIVRWARSLREDRQAGAKGGRT